MKQEYFEEAALSNNVEALKKLLTDPEVDPTKFNNYAIGMAYENECHDTVKLLWNDERVKSSLIPKNQELFDILREEEMQSKVEQF